VNTIGLIPAAGRATRLLPFRYPKELFPIAYHEPDGSSGETDVRVVCQDALDCLAAASVTKAFVVIGDHKFEVMRFLSDGREFGLDLAYLHQRDICGLPQAIDCAYPWIGGSNTALVLPDTIIEPRGTIAMLLDALGRSRPDIVLGVFPTDHPGDLCPVDFDEGGRVLGLHDKDPSRGIANTWGAAVWTPAFTEYLHCYLADASVRGGRELTLAEVLMSASRDGLVAGAVPVPGGKFVDIGRRSALVEGRKVIEARTPEKRAR
jgi:glucose-1-phosphate thymidylyltransferase